MCSLRSHYKDVFTTSVYHSDDSIDCNGNSNFLRSFTCWYDKQAVGSVKCLLYSPAPLEALQDPLLYFIDSMVAHLIMRPEKKSCLIKLRQDYRVVFIQDLVLLSLFASHDPTFVQI